jgi:hypothetical protein
MNKINEVVYMVVQRDETGKHPNISDFLFSSDSVKKMAEDDTLEDGDIIIELQVKTIYNVSVENLKKIQMIKV